MSLPNFSEESLENLLIAITKLKTTENKFTRVYPSDILTSEILNQFPWGVLSGMFRGGIQIAP